MTDFVLIEKIDVPSGWRKLRKPLLSQMVDSFKQDGQLQAIGIRPDTGNDGRFLLVYGRHRLEAARQCEWVRIEAKILTVDEKGATAATNAENLFRSELSAAEKVIALKSWYATYSQDHPDAHGKRAGALGRNRTSESEDEAPTFTKHASEATGRPEKTIQKYLYAAKNLTDEQLGVLAEHEVPWCDIKTIDSLEPEERKATTAFIASGMHNKEAIAQATLPKNATSETVGDPDSQYDEDDMDDDAWLEHHCGEVLVRIKDPDIYRRDAIFYRKTREIRNSLRKGVRKLLAQSKGSFNGPCYWAISRFANLDHPKNWLPCGPCGGAGFRGGGKCYTCRGDGYTLNSGAR